MDVDVDEAVVRGGWAGELMLKMVFDRRVPLSSPVKTSLSLSCWSSPARRSYDHQVAWSPNVALMSVSTLSQLAGQFRVHHYRWWVRAGVANEQVGVAYGYRAKQYRGKYHRGRDLSRSLNARGAPSYHQRRAPWMLLIAVCLAAENLARHPYGD